MTEHKIVGSGRLPSVIRRLKSSRKKIVFTNGTFDILHLGHVTYLEKAKACGDVLIIGVNSDASVKTYKHPDRPLNPLKDRMRVLAALECVDYVTSFEDPTPVRLILSIRPDILVKGGDWKRHQIAGAKEAARWGGEVKILPFVKGRSTTRLLNKIGFA